MFAAACGSSMAKYCLYYAGLDSPDSVEQIGLAISDDLRQWSQVQNSPVIPVGSAGAADAAQTSNPCVIKRDGRYRMWYQGKSVDGRTSVCYAESPDGIVWTADHEPVLSPDQAERGVYRAGFQHPHVVFDTARNVYRMWYVRQTEEKSVIGYAESSDGRHWLVVNGNVLTPEQQWEGSHVYYPFVRALADDSYELWYTGRSPGRTWQTGRATSKDGLVWAKDRANPILPPTMRGRRVRRILDIILGSLRFTVVKSLNGVASPFFFAADGRELLLTHDAGIRGRLSISLYERSSDAWHLKEHDVLASGARQWDAYFQADPFLLDVSTS